MGKADRTVVRCRLIGPSRAYKHPDGASVLVLQGTVGTVDSFIFDAAHVTWDQVMVKEEGATECVAWTQVYDPLIPIDQLHTERK